MSASSDQRKRIEEKLPHELLKELYLNSRVSIKELERKFGISHHTLSKCLKECEEKYDLKYTLDLDTNLLGFSEQRIIVVKFGNAVPDIKLLKKVLENDPFVQNAYMATGDFDLILHVIGLNNVEYNYWEFKFAVGFSRYRPHLKASTLNNFIEGFLPIRSRIISRSKEINYVEKQILMRLVENSRIRLKDLARSTHLSQMKTIYTINKLKNRGIIKQFTTCVQKPDKRIFLFYSGTITPNENHHITLFLSFVKKVIGEELRDEITTDYSVVCDTSGHFHFMYFCNFIDGESTNNRGPNFLKRVWESEEPIIEQSVLIDLIVGRWPFNTNGYVKWRVEMEFDEKNPVKFEIYK